MSNTAGSNNTSSPDFDEVGRIGQFRYAGLFYEEFLRELRGRRGCEVYKEMADNDDVIGAILFAIEMLMRQSSWNIDPGGPQEADKNAADFVDSCMKDMQETWSDTLSEILSFLTFGWSYHEIVYKRRMGQSRDPKLNSKYDDGLIGWRKLPIRSQDTLYRWEYDPNTDDLTGMTQMAPPEFALQTIPIEKAIHFVTKSRKANPEGRSILRNAYRCFDEGTEILTRDGWKSGAELRKGDELATLNPVTKALEYQRPSEIHRYAHKGKMLHFSSKFMDILVTSNHRMWVKKDRGADFGFVEASDVKRTHQIMRYADWSGIELTSYHLEAFYVSQRYKGGKEGDRLQYPAADVAMDDWIAFLALFLTEGCTYEKQSGQKLVDITQKEGDRANRMRALFAHLPFHVYEHKSPRRDIVNFEFCNAQLFEELCLFGKSSDKYVPAYVKALSPRQIRIFLDWYMFGDGMQVGNTKDGYIGTQVLGTVSKRMADDLQELGLKAGYESQISLDKVRRSALGQKPFYKVSLCGRRYHKIKRIESVDYDGQVWCPTTANGIVYVRRNGKPAWVGNCWYFKRRIQEIEAVGIERDLAGLPVMTPPENTDIWNKNDPTMVQYNAYAKRIVTNIRRDQQEGIVLPYGWTLNLLTTGGRRQFDTNAIIERYDSRIAMTVLADFVLLGHQQVGSFALSSDKTELFSVALGAFLDLICDTFNLQAIPRLIELNGKSFESITDYPKLIHGDVESPDLTELGNYIKDMTGVGVLTPDDNLENYVRRAAGLPEKLEQDYPAPEGEFGDDEDDDDDPDGVVEPDAGDTSNGGNANS